MKRIIFCFILLFGVIPRTGTVYIRIPTIYNYKLDNRNVEDSNEIRHLEPNLVEAQNFEDLDKDDLINIIRNLLDEPGVKSKHGQKKFERMFGGGTKYFKPQDPRDLRLVPLRNYLLIKSKNEMKKRQKGHPDGISMDYIDFSNLRAFDDYYESDDLNDDYSNLRAFNYDFRRTNDEERADYDDLKKLLRSYDDNYRRTNNRNNDKTDADDLKDFIVFRRNHDLNNYKRAPIVPGNDDFVKENDGKQQSIDFSNFIRSLIQEKFKNNNNKSDDKIPISDLQNHKVRRYNNFRNDNLIHLAPYKRSLKVDNDFRRSSNPYNYNYDDLIDARREFGIGEDDKFKELSYYKRNLNTLINNQKKRENIKTIRDDDYKLHDDKKSINEDDHKVSRRFINFDNNNRINLARPLKRSIDVDNDFRSESNQLDYDNEPNEYSSLDTRRDFKLTEEDKFKDFAHNKRNLNRLLSIDGVSKPRRSNPRIVNYNIALRSKLNGNSYDYSDINRNNPSSSEENYRLNDGFHDLTIYRRDLDDVDDRRWNSPNMRVWTDEEHRRKGKKRFKILNKEESSESQESEENDREENEREDEKSSEEKNDSTQSNSDESNSIEVTTKKNKYKKNKGNNNKNTKYMLLQGKRLVKDGRRRMEHFLPKRYLWTEDDIKKLNNIWFYPKGVEIKKKYA